ncbi:MAG: LytTR family transcriptional regulator DNA-binding domain-containing protein [Maricaulaceae bacterium]
MVLAGILIFFSPSVTAELDFEERFAFWIYLCLIGGVGIFLSDIILDLIGLRRNLVKFITGSILGTYFVLKALFAVYEAHELPSIEVTVAFVWIVMALILVLERAFRRRSKKAETTPEDPKHKSVNPLGDISIRSKLRERLPLNLREGGIYALSAEDHYVRVYTSAGEHMLLIRLSDAISEMGEIDGQRPHRSWWIAKSAVKHIKQLGRNGEITLVNDVVVPVSRNGLKTLKSVNWL